MSWLITPSAALVDDPDAMTYLADVEAADGQALEPATRLAVNAFIKGCKADGIWPAIKASCILSGARTLAGALVPLVGSAPTSFNFVSGDYNRKTGLVGDGATKYLGSNRSNSADPQNSRHVSVYITTRQTVNSCYLACATTVNGSGDTYLYASSDGSINTGKIAANGTPSASAGTNLVSGIYALNRFNSATSQMRRANATVSGSVASVSPVNEDLRVFGTTALFSNARLAFYSIGESLDLALLDTRVTALVNAFAAAIP